jgi:hypothetical protein
MKGYLVILIAILAVPIANAKSSLLYLEAQGVVGYSSMERKTIYYSGHRDDYMQKSGLGFDYLKKFSTEIGDVGSGALQMRLVWNEEKDRLQLQTYNAYLKGKTRFGDFWLGHNRIAFGLASYLDTHAELLQPLSMQVFGFDRDWGGGFSRDFQNGDFMLAVTSGSGMNLKTEGNYILSSRASFGVLARDNYNFGLSLMGGKTLESMGYSAMDDNLQKILLASVDFSLNYNNFEHKIEVDFGEKNKTTAKAAFYRIGINFLEENRLKLEGQYAYVKIGEMDNVLLGIGTTYKINSTIAMRLMFQKEREMDDKSVIAQIYYYFGV